MDTKAAWQTAFVYAQERKQGKVAGIQGAAPILHHADVRRMLDRMDALGLGARAIAHLALVIKRPLVDVHVDVEGSHLSSPGCLAGGQ